MIIRSKGLYSINISMAVYVVGDVCVKLLGPAYPPGQIIFCRSGVVALVAGLLLAMRGALLSRRLIGPALLARCTFDFINTFGFVIAITHLQLAECYAILQTAPLLMTILAVILFKEPVGWRRMLAITFGFGGALLIIRPDTGAFNQWSAAVALCSLAAACREVVTTKIDRGASTLEVIFASTLFTSVAALLLSFSEAWRMPAASDTAILFMMAASWATGTLFLIYACRLGPLSVVAFFRYTLLLWGGIAGYFVFGEWPDAWSITGAMIIVLSGFYIFHREAVRRRPLASRV